MFIFLVKGLFNSPRRNFVIFVFKMLSIFILRNPFFYSVCCRFILVNVSGVHSDFDLYIDVTSTSGRGSVYATSGTSTLHIWCKNGSLGYSGGNASSGIAVYSYYFGADVTFSNARIN